MFRATLLPSASVYGKWTSVKDVCVWEAVDDELWNQFAGALGDASLQNLSIEEAIEATASGAVGRTKLRLVYAATRLKFDLDPIDVGAPPPTAAAEPVVVVGPRGGTSCLKVKVATVLDQASDREVDRLPLEVLRKLRARFRAVEGEDPRRRRLPTTVALSGNVGAKKFPGPTHCLRGRRAGVSSALRPSCAISQRPQFWTVTQQHSAREWSASRTVGRCVLSRTPGTGVNIGRKSIGGSHCSTTRVRSCQFTSLSAHGTASFASPPRTEIVGRRSWRIRSWTSGRFGQWSRRRQGEVDAGKKSGAGRGLQRVQRGSNEAVSEVVTHSEEAMDGVAPIPLAIKSASNSIGTLVDAQETVQRSEHTCASSAWSHTVPWNVREILGGGHHPKVRERGSTRVRGECCVHPGRGVKRQHDTILKSASAEKVSVVVRGRSPRRVQAREGCPLP